MQSKQGIAVGASIPPAQKPPPGRSDKELAREVQLAESLADGNPAKIAKNISKLIHDPLRLAAKDFAASKDLAERARLHQHRLSLVTCLIRADAAVLLNGPAEALKADRAAKIDAPLQGIKEKLQAERSAWKGDEAGFSAKFATFIAHRNALVSYAEQADQKLQPKPPASSLSDRLGSFGKKAGSLFGNIWGGTRDAVANLVTSNRVASVGKGLAGSAAAVALAAGLSSSVNLTGSFNETVAKEPVALSPIVAVNIGRTPVKPVTVARQAPAPDDEVEAPRQRRTEIAALTQKQAEPDSSRKKAASVAQPDAPVAHTRARASSPHERELRTTLSASIAEWATSNLGKKYRWGSNNSRFVDCSQFLMGGLRAVRAQFESMHGVNLEIQGLNAIASQITKVMATTGGYLSGSHVTQSKMAPGMIIGVDSGPRGWDKDRWKGIDHIAITYSDPATGTLYVTESTSEKDPTAKKTGVRTMPLEEWMTNAQRRGYKLFAADILSLAQSNGAAIVAKLSNPVEKEKPARAESSYKYATYSVPASGREPTSPGVIRAAYRTEAFNTAATSAPVLAQESRVEVPASAHAGIGDAEREQARIWMREQAAMGAPAQPEL